MKRNKSTSMHAFVLVEVLLICGGNGVSILAGGLIWKLTGRLALAVTALVLITVAVFGTAMALVAAYLHVLARAARTRQVNEEVAEADLLQEPGSNASGPPEAERQEE